MAAEKIEAYQRLIKVFPRKKLISRPTPIAEMESLNREFNGPNISIKRDDLTGLAFGGNKSRKLEFILADAKQKGYQTVVTWGSLQSNWCMQLAAAASKIGLKPVLVLFKTYDLPSTYDGNIFLERLLGAEIIVKDSPVRGKSLDQEIAFSVLQELAEKNKEKWPHPYLVSVGGSTTGGNLHQPLGALAYFSVIIELMEQLGAENMPDYIVLATGSGGTQSGLLVGAKALGLKTKILGICVSDRKDEFQPVVERISRELVNMLGLEIKIEPEDIILFDEYLGPGYGYITEGIAKIIEATFKKEGVVLDPVYTGKAMLGLVDLLQKNYFSKEDRILFLHTGGTPALFAFREKILSYL
ncbi:MAG: D-cysteine desulfhydrase family protein [Candidatus Aminicenantes bacterium]|nr:D-cysteine desulfhydrase family protein [Candidatus Aminicenantes bacterium]